VQRFEEPAGDSLFRTEQGIFFAEQGILRRNREFLARTFAGRIWLIGKRAFDPTSSKPAPTHSEHRPAKPDRQRNTQRMRCILADRMQCDVYPGRAVCHCLEDLFNKTLLV
jgi:hypothetical protein